MFPNLNDDARIWIFIPDRELTDDQQRLLLHAGEEFISQWHTHGKPLNAYSEILGSSWILAADEREVQASGCSMDKINLFVKRIQTQFGVDFFNRMKVLEQENGGWHITDFHPDKLDHIIHSALVKLGDLRIRID